MTLQFLDATELESFASVVCLVHPLKYRFSETTVNCLSRSKSVTRETLHKLTPLDVPLMGGYVSDTRSSSTLSQNLNSDDLGSIRKEPF